MCLSIKVDRPQHVLAEGKHLGYEWVIVHNTSGYRCGYVRIPLGHPWHGKGEDGLNVDVHGGLTFAQPDKACHGDREDNAWWLGFDCAHCGDAKDPSLLSPEKRQWEEDFNRRFLEDHPEYTDRDFGETIKDTNYVKKECRRLCAQAKAAVGGKK